MSGITFKNITSNTQAKHAVGIFPVDVCGAYTKRVGGVNVGCHAGNVAGRHVEAGAGREVTGNEAVHDGAAIRVLETKTAPDNINIVP